jgi:hypothetical protein
VTGACKSTFEISAPSAGDSGWMVMLVIKI